MGEETKVSKAQQKAVHKYVKANYDRLDLTMPKGQKNTIKARSGPGRERERLYQSGHHGGHGAGQGRRSAPGGQSISPRPCGPRAGVDSGPGGAYNEHRKGRCDKRLARDVKNPKAKP